MAKFVVRGASMDTGRLIEVVLDAPNALAAQERANHDLRIAVSEVDVEPARPEYLRLPMPDQAGRPPTPVLVEQTSKHWKMLMLVFGGAFCLGFVLILTPTFIGGLVGMFLLLGGGIGYAVARIAAWWHHG